MIPFIAYGKCNHENTKTRKRHHRLLRVFVPSWPEGSASPLTFPQPQSFAIVAAGLHGVAPVAMVEVPARCRFQAVLECAARRPSELTANLAGVDGVAPIVAGTIGHKCLQGAIAGHPRELEGGIGTSGPQRFEHLTDSVDDLEIGPFVAAADIVLFTGAPLPQHEQ